MDMDNEHKYEPTQQLICRIQSTDPTQYIWPELNYKQFVIQCLHDFEQYLQSPDLEHLQRPQEKHQETDQQQREIHRQKDFELEL